MNKKWYIILFFLSFCLMACDDIFLKDISDKSIEVVAPADGVVLSNNAVTLVWNSLEGAEEYHVVIVSPSFSNIQTYVCDSVTNDYKLKITLDAGAYEWSVQGRNSGYATPKEVNGFEIAIP